MSNLSERLGPVAKKYATVFKLGLCDQNRSRFSCTFELVGLVKEVIKCSSFLKPVLL